MNELFGFGCALTGVSLGALLGWLFRRRETEGWREAFKDAAFAADVQMQAKKEMGQAFQRLARELAEELARERVKVCELAAQLAKQPKQPKETREYRREQWYAPNVQPEPEPWWRVCNACGYEQGCVPDLGMVAGKDGKEFCRCRECGFMNLKPTDGT